MIPEVGKTYKVNDSRKGKFTMRVTSINGEWYTGIIVHPSRIFVGSTIEIFGDWVIDAWRNCIFDQVKLHPQHTFIFLTKCPYNLAKYNPWTDNCWVGATAINDKMFMDSVYELGKVKAKVKFVSLEPLHSKIGLFHYLPVIIKSIDWVIIGAETGNRKGKPALADVHKWAGEIIKAADEAGIPVFLKDNLKWPVVRREFPNQKGEG